MRGYRKTILTLAFAIAPLSAQQANKAPVCNPPGKDEVCFDARTTGSLGQMHVGYHPAGGHRRRDAAGPEQGAGHCCEGGRKAV